MLTGTTLCLICWSLVRQGGTPAPDALPAPRPTVTMGYVQDRPPLSPFHRTGWRPLPPEPLYGYARDRYGYMRPRIILGPHGVAYYPLTGEPYLFYPIRTAP